MPYRRHQHCSGLQRLVKDASHPKGFVLDKPLKVRNQESISAKGAVPDVQLLE
jgi:hypothetical protein